MLHLSFFVLLLNITNGVLLNSTLEYWRLRFANKIDEVLGNNKYGLSIQCNNHLSYYAKGLKSREEWALKMLDAGAYFPPPGMLEGNLVNLGSFDECLNVEKRTNKLDIFGKYCLGNTVLNANSQQIPRFDALNPLPSLLEGRTTDTVKIYLGKCFPDACSAAEMEKVYGGIDFKITFSEEHCQTKASQPTLDTGSWAAIYTCGVILCLIIFSTVFDVVLYYTQKKSPHQVLIAFSAFTNFKNLIRTSSTSNDISCLHGIRVISMLWVVIRHRSDSLADVPITNLYYYIDLSQNNPYMFVMQQTVILEVFFLLSGLLVAYNYMTATSKGVKFNFIRYCINRYVRLTPVLAVVVVFHLTLLRHVGSGPMWPTEIENKLVKNCEESWWRALLYIQTIYFGTSNLCIPPSWYLCADMQLYILSPLIFIWFKKWPRFAFSITGVFAVGSIVASFAICWFYELNASMVFNRGVKFTNYMWYYYYPIHTRAASWLIGIALGYLIFKVKEGKIKFPKNKVILICLWTASLALIYTCFCTGKELAIEEYNRVANSFRLALIGPVFAIALAWIIFACVDGHAGPVNWFFSLPMFKIISKLTFNIYLTHFTFIYIITAQVRTPTPFSGFQVVYTFWSDFICVLFISFILALAVEFPVMTIHKCVTEGNKKTSK